MRLLWLCNVKPGKVREALDGQAQAGGLWVDSVLAGLRREGETIHILCPGGENRGRLDEHISYVTFREGLPYVYLPELEQLFTEEIRTFRPDVIHIWGTEYGHSLAMMNAAETCGMLSHTAVSIQGLCSVIAGHYTEGIPHRIQGGYTFRDFVRRDNILQQQKKFSLRGELEVKVLERTRHIIGRTDWDRACTSAVNPQAEYHFCNETLREPFYTDQWRYGTCRKHRIFAGSCEYPVKGFHYLLEAFAQVSKAYPDAELAVPGKSFLEASRLRRTRYQKYLGELARRYGLEDRIEFLGSLSGEEMKQAYLSANVFVLPSTVENSPNSLGEAMLLGMPCVAADVGGVTNLMAGKTEGFLYPSTAPYMLAYWIRQVFQMEEKAEAMGLAARERAAVTHDPQGNLTALMEIYRALA